MTNLLTSFGVTCRTGQRCALRVFSMPDDSQRQVRLLHTLDSIPRLLLLRP